VDVQLQVLGCIQKFPDWPLGAGTANGTALYHYVRLYRYFVSQSSEFCRYSPLCCFSNSVSCCCCLFRYGLSPETFRYTSVFQGNTTIWVEVLRKTAKTLCTGSTRFHSTALRHRSDCTYYYELI